VAATTTGTVVITLPASNQILAGQTVSVTGTSANNWQIAQNPGQTVLTAGMAGNVAPAANWTPRLAPKAWHWVSSNAAGDVLVAGEGVGGNLHTSVDSGINWTAGDSVSGPTWISSAISATGERIVAVQYGGRMYMSTNHGVNWTPVTIPDLDTRVVDPNPDPNNQPFESVTISSDGLRIVAAIQNGPIVFSNDAGLSWVAGTIGGTLLTGSWRSVDSSADGAIVMAADQNGDIYRSTDGGLTWSLRMVNVDSVTVFENWYRLQMSDNGNVVVAVGNTFGGAPGTGIHVSRDAGLTWTKAHSLVADYTAIAMSGDGKVIAVTASNLTGGSTGSVLRSTNGDSDAPTFAPVTMPVGDTNWRAIAMSSDGNKLAVAAGLFLPTTAGQLYTSLGNRTEMGPLGSITGGQGLSAEFEYVGNGQYRVKSSSGGTFAIQ
jgi:hypothetical protein